MERDEVTWDIISKQSCSFQGTINTQNLCSNVYNLTGSYSQPACPFANSQYAIVREENGVIFLYIVTTERNPFPVKHCKKVKLSNNYDKALYQIKKNLLYWERWVQKKCKQRFRKTRQNLVRMRSLLLHRQKKLIPLSTKVVRRKRLTMGMHHEAHSYPQTLILGVFVTEELKEASQTNEMEQDRGICEDVVESYDSDTGSESEEPVRNEVDSELKSNGKHPKPDIEEFGPTMTHGMTKCVSENDDCTSAGSTKKCDTSGNSRKLDIEDESALVVKELEEDSETNGMEQEQETSEELVENYDSDTGSESRLTLTITLRMDIEDYVSNMSINEA
ncbi:protein MAK16 homolog [Anopheles marshallii]|uniref:protein MAK16 homolog n=1 Tax=Anopheles marshallii TaxID=1521116 RepID=UPI00237BFFF6|nr:protein MAK16 homolog [Anopheles marshallii]